MQRWNPKTRNYEPYIIPKNWYCPVMIYDMEKIVNCVSCGKKIKFGDGFTSRFIHTENGFAYTVCTNCHKEEYEQDE